MIRITIPINNDLRFIDLVDSLIKADIDKYLDKVSVLLSLNAPTEKVKDAVNTLLNKKPDLIRVISTEEKGIAAAKNNAIKQFLNSTSHFLFIDSDCVVNTNYIKNLVALINDNKLTEVFRGDVVFISDTNKLFSILNCKLRNSAYKIRTTTLLSPNLGISSSVFEKAGLLNQNLKAGEDLEFSQRVTEFNIYSSFFPELVIYHRDDLHFIAKTLKTIANYGKDRGFRVYRRSLLENKSFPITLAHTVLNALKIQNYWEKEPKFSLSYFFFCIGYLLVSRISALKSLFYWKNFNRNFFLEVDMIDGTKRKIKYLPPEYDLP